MTFPSVARRLVDLVFRGQQFGRLGLRGTAEVVFREVCGRGPTRGEIDQVVRDFWQLWHDTYDTPRPPPPSGGGSPHYELEDLSPAQENAIRALEECDWDEPGGV
jgi:hypothetical protein